MKMLFSKAVVGWIVASFTVTPPLLDSPTTCTVTGTCALILQPSSSSSSLPSSPSSVVLQRGVVNWLAAAAVPAPSPQDVQLLRSAFAEFYGVNRDLVKSELLLSQVVAKWQGQPPDELAGLYRVRGDCYMAMADAVQAVADYDQAIKLLKLPEAVAVADPEELPAALLGRARAAKSLVATTTAAANPKGTKSSSSSQQWAASAANDYEAALTLASRAEDWDTDTERLEDGASRNPYAAWEWGDALRRSSDFPRATKAHLLASAAFEEIGDRARSVIALTDAGIDLAANAYQVSEAKAVLQTAIGKTTGVEGRDVSLLRRVFAKEGEGRMALAALLWSDGQRGEAETVLGDACVRLDQLQADVDLMVTKKSGSSSSTVLTESPAPRLLFSIDDDEYGLGMLSCSKFKNQQFLTDKLGWPASLQKKVINLETLR